MLRISASKLCFFLASLAFFAEAQTTQGTATKPAQAPPLLTIVPGHPWRPPFGLERVGQPTHLIIQPPAALNTGEDAALVAYRGGNAVSRDPVAFQGSGPVMRDIDPTIERVVLLAGKGETWRELAAVDIARDKLEAEAVARPEALVNPIDLGAIFPPADWLVLSPSASAQLRVAAFCRTMEKSDARVVAWFDAQPSQRVKAALLLNPGQRVEVEAKLPEPSFQNARDTLQVSIQAPDGAELWHKTIHVMLVAQPPVWPRFGASETKLRYDMPISLLAKNGTLSTMPYEQGWSPELNDVVVSLPNGSRFVFWRGSSYVPFWAGRSNMALCHEWAETGPLPEGFVDCVEPLMDKELRYSRVRIIESTTSRVHVRWNYQSCDFNYKVWGDAAQEDFYFYPDGFATRVLTLCGALNADYELSEFIVLAPPEAYPFDVLPADPIRCLGLDGTTMTIPMPFVAEQVPPGPKPPVVYRVQFGKDDSSSAVYFNPRDPFRPEQLDMFRPFYEGDCMVTPAYWGSHWPLARGKTTGWAIDDRIHVSPSHNSLMSWARHRPEPVWTRIGPSIDTLGCSKQMQTQCWVWMLGVTNVSDEDLLARARSFDEPASLEVQGARIDIESYSMERRAYRLIVDDKTVTITVKPTVPCVNPVFELLNAPQSLERITLGKRPLQDDEYAWDGQTLWLGATIAEPIELALGFVG